MVDLGETLLEVGHCAGVVLGAQGNQSRDVVGALLVQTFPLSCQLLLDASLLAQLFALFAGPFALFLNLHLVVRRKLQLFDPQCVVFGVDAHLHAGAEAMDGDHALSRAEALEEFVGEHFLAVWSDQEVLRRVEKVSGDDEAKAKIDAAIKGLAVGLGATNDEEVADAPTRQLRALRAERRRLEGLPMKREVSWEPTGETYAEVWARVGMEERRAMLEENVAVVSVRRGPGGRRVPVGQRVTIMSSPTEVVEQGSTKVVAAGRVVWLAEDEE